MKKALGLTLIELIMVMLLVSILSVVGFISITSYSTQHLRGAAEKIAADLRYTKNLAQSSSSWHGAIFSVNPDNSYYLYETNGTTDTKIKKAEDPGQDLEIDLSEDYGNVIISSVNIEGGLKVEFDPYGIPYDDKNGGALTADGVVKLTLDGSSVTVTVSKEGGRITIQ